MIPSREPLPGEAPFHAPDELADSPGNSTPEAGPPDVAEESCRRCRKLYPVTAERCPYCGAGNPAHGDKPRNSVASTGGDLQPLNVVIGTFGVMLLLSVLFMIGFAATADLRGDHLRRELMAISILEGIDTIIVAVAGVLLLRVPDPRDPTRPLAAWLLSVPILLAALVINHAYHALIHSLGIPVHDLPFDPSDSRLLVWGLATICLQPALVEEWFFRGIAWKALRKYLGIHGTVWVVAVMFAAAHIGAFLSIPVLILLGGLLGYARLYSGGLLLPIVMHFLHNLLISLWSTVQ